MLKLPLNHILILWHCTGVENDALRVGGEGPGADKREVEHYNGVAWSLGGSKIDYGHCSGATAGTRTNGLFFGGCNPAPACNNTEHYESFLKSLRKFDLWLDSQGKETTWRITNKISES